MAAFWLLLGLFFLISNCPSIRAKVYWLGTKPYSYTILEERPTFSRFTCMALCGQKAACHTVIWKKTFPRCVLVGSGGTTLLSSFNGSLPFHTSQVDVTISPGSIGVSSGSDPMNAFATGLSSYYKSAYLATQTNLLGFRITFGTVVNLTAIELVQIDLGQATPSFMHWHPQIYAYCESSTPYPRPTGVVIRFICPGAPAVNWIDLDVIYQGYFGFNNFKIIGIDNVIVYP